MGLAMKSQNTAQACAQCHSKKIRCVGGASRGGCLGCRTAAVPCYSRPRKKRQITRQTSVRHIDADSGIEDTSRALYSSTPQGSDPIRLTSPIRAQQRLPSTSSTTTPQLPLPVGYGAVAQIPQPPANDLAVNLQWDHFQSHTGTDAPCQDSVVDKAPRSVPVTSLTETPTFIGRDHYIREDEQIDETTARAFHASTPRDVSDLVAQTLRLWKTFEVPTKSARNSLVDSYHRRCFPWTPVLERQDEAQIIDQIGSSMFLSQCLFLAASRVSSSPMITAYATSQQFYERAKTLFWLSYEKDPLIVLKGILMLQWFNPDGPEHLSFDSSEFWLKIGVGIAHQIGLHRDYAGENSRAIRRRLWWSLVARDCLISASHGRPRAINLEDCQVRPPAKSDFPDDPAEADVFLPYVEICCLLGDITDCCSRHHLPSSKRLQIESMLFRWLRTLSPTLKLTPTTPAGSYAASDSTYDARLLHLHYFSVVSILSKYTTPKNYVPHEAVFAASFAAGVFETLLARDEIKYLAPPFTIFCLICSMVLVSLRPFTRLWQAAQPDIWIFQQCLVELSKRWRSAIGASKALQNALDGNRNAGMSKPFKAWEWDQSSAYRYFEGCALELCRLWQPLHKEVEERNLVLVLEDQQENAPNSVQPLGGVPPEHCIGHAFDATAFSGPGGDAMALFQYDHINHWLLEDSNFTEF